MPPEVSDLLVLIILTESEVDSNGKLKVRKCVWLLSVHLGVSQAQSSHAAGTVRFGVDAAKFLFDGAEVGHERIQVHVLPLVQCLCANADTSVRC